RLSATACPVTVLQHPWRRNLAPDPYVAPIPVFVSPHGEPPGARGTADPSWPCSPVPERAKPAFFASSASRIPAAPLPVNVIRHRWRRNLDPAPNMAPIPVFVSTHGETPGARGAADPSWLCSPVPERANPAFFAASASRTPATSLPLNGIHHP